MRPGERIGPYRLLHQIGKGGMGVVFAAEHERVGQRVAIKRLLSSAPEHTARFLQEARALSRIDHPSVVRILSCDKDEGGLPYLVMEYVEGPSLRDWLRERGGPVSAAEAIALVRQIADAMAAVHASGIVHRDLKPENLLCLPRPQGGPTIKIIDFGIARVPPPAAPLRDTADTLVETGTGGPRWLGTALYMSPEQCRRSAPVGDSADVYALGVLLYELLSGHPPFQSAEPIEVAAMHLGTPPDLSPLRSVAPPALLGLLTAMLAKTPVHRPGMTQVCQILDRIDGGPDRPADPGRRALGGLVLAAAGLGALLLRPRWVRGLLARIAPLLPGSPIAIDRPADGVPADRMDPGSPAGLVLLTQPVLFGITLPQQWAALPRAYRTLPCQQVAVAPGEAALSALQRGDFSLAAHQLLGDYRERIAPLQRQHPDYRMVYFGSAPIPLAVLLGALVSTWQEAEVVHHHHKLRSWGFTGRSGPPPRLLPVPPPEHRDERPGDVVVRLATSVPVDPLTTRPHVPAPLWEVDLRLDRLDEDAFCSSAEVQAVADEWKRVLGMIVQSFPRVGRVHLFAAVPAGLAFLLGTRLSPTLHPPIQTYSFIRSQGHRPALLINQGSQNMNSLFRRFYEKIHVSYKDSAELRQRRDDVLAVLQKAQLPSFTWQNQGSYEMGTGVKPINGGDYDIDVSLFFKLQRSAAKPTEVKGWVHEALPTSLGRIEWRWPCITVFRRGHHVDLAIYADEGGAHYLALGKQHDHRQRWELHQLREFIKRVEEHYTHSEDSFQFRRVICYLKRWKDVQHAQNGVTPPTGLALTVMAYHWFGPQGNDDLGALLALVNKTLQKFNGDRLDLRFPVEPHNDLLEKMSAEQIKQLKGRLLQLAGWLQEAQSTRRTQPLIEAFGPDFPAS